MSYEILKIEAQHDSNISEIIMSVGEEFGVLGEGFGPSDPEVSAMSQNYHDANASCYFVAVLNDTVVGGCGIAPFNGSREVCELRKLFLLPSSRGLGLGRTLSNECLNYARSKAYKTCYLDTLQRMRSATALYESLGFKYLNKPLEGTIHNACDTWMLMEL